MRVLLVEPIYRRNPRSAASVLPPEADSSANKRDDELLWYPPLGLMKLATYHKKRKDEVHFVRGCDLRLPRMEHSCSTASFWDRVYISTLFTFNWRNTVDTVKFYRNLLDGGLDRIFVGGIMASLMPDEIYSETGIYPVTGIIDSPQKIGLEGTENIDLLPPDYDILDHRYAIADTYYAYTTRGCVNQCEWCGVPVIEPQYLPYIDMRDMLREVRERHGDKSKLKLMDNNVLASPYLPKIVADLLELGYGRNDLTDTKPRRRRVVDFNQGLDARFITEDSIALLAKLNVTPIRIAFDRIGDKRDYVRAVTLAKHHGFRRFSNYMLYNCRDTPKDLYERLMVNIRLSEEWRDAEGKPTATVYSYPMRYAPIRNDGPQTRSSEREYVDPVSTEDRDILANPSWNKRFTRNIEVMKGAAHGAIPATPSLARRTVGETYEEFIANLYMPEEMLRYRNTYEKRTYNGELGRQPGSGDIEDFRAFILAHLRARGEKFRRFHQVVSQNSKRAIEEYLIECEDEQTRKWLGFYLKSGPTRESSDHNPS